MSDINVLPGIGLLLASLALIVFGALFMIVFLIVAKLTQRHLPFRRRLAFSLFIGMWLPILLGWVGVLLSSFASLALRTSLDSVSLSLLIAVCLLFLLFGVGLGAWRYKR